MINWKKDGVSLALLALILVSMFWDRHQRNNLNNIMSAVCLEGLKVSELKQRVIFLDIERLARAEGKNPKANLADIATLAHQAQKLPTEMDQAFDHFVECSKKP